MAKHTITITPIKLPVEISSEDLRRAAANPALDFEARLKSKLAEQMRRDENEPRLFWATNFRPAKRWAEG